MELVKGQPITKYCDEHRLTPRERLELFIAVCQAIQHAHQKAIIHRDIKPSNVLVAPYDGKPVVKVIDFGVAKATGQRLTNKTLFTEFGSVIGTLEYMSPEQAEVNNQDIDTRSDIYALGVLLYELLTGTTPLNRAHRRAIPFTEVLRMIREEEPPRPSTRLSQAKGSLPAISAQRQMEPAKLKKLVRGELDWIVMKALEKDRTRRYETANAFAADIRRYLADEAVHACPPSLGYRLRKFVRRNKGPALAASLVVLTFVAGFTGTVREMVRATRAEATAVDEAAQKEAALKDTEAALAAARQSKRARTEQLWEALVAEARATRLSRRPGQRFKSLEILRRAIQLARGLDLPAAKLHELRNAALATLAVPDLYLTGPWKAWPADAYGCDFDENHAIYARSDRQGACSIRRVADDVEIHHLPGRGRPAVPRLRRDGKFIAVACDIAVDVWDLGGTVPHRVLSKEHAHLAVFHPSAQQVALVYDDGAVGLFDLGSGTQLKHLAPDTLTREVTIDLHPTEPLVAVCSYFGAVVQLRDTQTGKVLARLPQGARPASVIWHPDGRTLAVGLAEARQVRLYDRTTLRLFRTLDTVSTASHLAFNHAGDRLATNGWSGSVELFDVRTGQKLFTTPPMNWPTLRFNPDDQWLAGAVDEGKLGTWQVGDSREYRTLVHRGLPPGCGYSSVALSPDGRLLAAGTTVGFGLWDLASGSEIVFVPTGRTSKNLVHFEPSGALLVLASTGLFRWAIPRDLATRPGVIGPPERLPLPCGSALGQSSDGRVIVSCCRAVAAEQAYAGGWILHTDRSGPPIRIDAGADIGFITVSSDGRWVVTVTHPGGRARVWDARDGKLVRQLAERGAGYPWFSPDGRWLSTAVEGGRLVAVGTWKWGPKRGYGAFSPDSKLLAVPTIAGIRLIDHSAGREVALLEDPNLDLTGQLCFAPDGTMLIALNYANGVHVWDLRLIRRQLKAMGLDWEWPEFAADTENTHAPPASVPPVVRVVGAEQLLDGAAWSLQADAHARARQWEKSIACYRRAIQLEPRDARSRNNLAWTLATCPDVRFRDPAQAVKMAREAVALIPAQGEYWNTLGAALYRAGSWKEAVAALEKSIEFRGGGDSFDWFFLAMAQWKLGQKDRARQGLARAVAWMEKNQPSNNELRRFRAEAGDLIQVEAKKD
jgi:WD40 repeat protein/tetratricopeptide (TPR) repeat protein